MLYTFHTHSDTPIGEKTLKTIHCYHCQHAQEITDFISRHSTCSNCDLDLKICYHCCFFDNNSHHQCRETEAEWVKNKEQANFCDYFSASNQTTPKKDVDHSTNKLHALFNDSDDKKKPISQKSLLDDLEKLFK